MSKINDAIRDFGSVDEASRREGLLKGINPLVKLLVTVLFLVITLSRRRYDLVGVLIMFAYPVVTFIIGEVSLKEALKKLKIVLPLLMLLGVLEPFFDKNSVTAGVVAGLTLILKGLLAVLGAYLLITTTPIEEICGALRKIRVPRIIVTVILLIYRYMGILMAEGKRIMNAYSLRAPGQKGVAFKAWGPLLGQMLLRSMDRADNLYQSMQLRGFSGDLLVGDYGMKKSDIMYFILWTAVLITVRVVF